MRVLWFGINDEGGCVLSFHELRCELRDRHGVELAGPGYSWEIGTGTRKLSEILEGEYDWIVLDDSNAKGYVPIIPDVHPSARIAWRENDWHNRRRWQAASRWEPEIIFGLLDRAPGQDPWREHPGWKWLPHAVTTSRFHPGNGQERIFNAGFYGRTGAAYRTRTEARRRLSGRDDVWIGQHGGYWKDGKQHDNGTTTFYNDNLADRLRLVKCLYVAPGNMGSCVMKYFEGAACGCLLFGEIPYGWDAIFPSASIVRCSPEEVNDVVDFYSSHDVTREQIAERATRRCLEEHSIERRAEQIMEVLRACIGDDAGDSNA